MSLFANTVLPGRLTEAGGKQAVKIVEIFIAHGVCNLVHMLVGVSQQPRRLAQTLFLPRSISCSSSVIPESLSTIDCCMRFYFLSSARTSSTLLPLSSMAFRIAFCSSVSCFAAFEDFFAGVASLAAFFLGAAFFCASA